MNFIKVVTLISLSGYSFCDTTFVHLLGSSIYADTLSTYSTLNATDCVEECAVTTSCSAVKMIWGSGTCELLTMIRAAVSDNANCAFYIRKYNDVEIQGRTLDGIDQLVQNAVYASQADCPDGWTAGSTTCTLSVSESICDEYAPFLEASWDGTDCVIPLMNVTYYCPNDTYTLGSYADGHYCHSMINKWPDNPENKTYQIRSDEYCYEQTGGRLASIHSVEENTVINGYVV
uniref:Apple domain-containing protein n=1 Tax=Panagrellus redivivus TaxID=6233 RepID=A0A7E4V9J6_PANRE